MPSVLSDEHFANKARLGDKQAFSLLVTRHHAALRAMLRNLCHLPDVADDLAQQSLISAWSKLGQFGGNNFKGWLYRIAFREFLMWKRTQKNTVVSADEQDEVSCKQIEKVTIQQAFDQLSDSQREILTLIHFGGFTHSEISEMANIPLGTVKSHAQRGMRQLKTLIGEKHE